VVSGAKGGDDGPDATEVLLQFVENYASDDPALEVIRGQCHTRRFDADEWTSMRPEVSRVVQVFGGLIRDGWFFIRPQDGPRGHCAQCDFGTVCRKGNARSPRKAERMAELGSYWSIVRPETR